MYRGRAVHGDRGDVSFSHQLDEISGETAFNDVRADHPDDLAFPARRGAANRACEGLETLRGELPRKGLPPARERVPALDRIAEIAHRDLASPFPDGNGSDAREIHFVESTRHFPVFPSAR